MKELTKEQKLDFILYCMEKIDEVVLEDYWFTCNELISFFKVANLYTLEEDEKDEMCKCLFPELIKYSSEIEIIKFWDYGCVSFFENKTRAIIYSFLYNELTGRIKV